MSITDYLLAFVPEQYRRDVRFGTLILAFAWLAFTFNARVADAEQKANKVERLSDRVVTIEQSTAVTRQQVDDIDKNVQTLVTVVVGRDAVVNHPVPPPPPLAKTQPTH